MEYPDCVTPKAQQMIFNPGIANFPLHLLTIIRMPLEQ